MRRRWYIPKNACCVIEGSVWEHKRNSSAARTPRHGASMLAWWKHKGEGGRCHAQSTLNAHIWSLNSKYQTRVRGGASEFTNSEFKSCLGNWASVSHLWVWKTNATCYGYCGDLGKHYEKKKVLSQVLRSNRGSTNVSFYSINHMTICR